MLERELRFGRYAFEASNLDKVLFPEDGITKGELVDYYRRIFDLAGRHYRERSVTMHRFPDGIAADGFYQQEISDHFPGWVSRRTMPKEDGTITRVIIDKAATLAYLAEQGCITPHLSLARVDRPDHPDRMVFDLDPSDDDFAKVCASAKLLRGEIESLGLVPYVQTTGSRGLHVVVPLDRSADFDRVRAAARGIGAGLAEKHPDLVTIEQRKRSRGDRVYIDYLRNAFGQTAVAPYAVRPLPGAPVATPLDWEEVDRPDLGPRRYGLKSIFRRLGHKADPWRNIARRARSLERALSN